MSNRTNKRVASLVSDNSNLTQLIREIIDNKVQFLIDNDNLENESLIKKLKKVEDSFNEYYKSVYKESGAPGNNGKDIFDDKELVYTLLQMMKDKIELNVKDLASAEDIQRKLLPEKMPTVKGYDVAAYYHPSKHIGGDYYDFFPVGENRLYFLVADVSGHGISSSLVVSSIQSFICAQVKEQKSLYATIENLNSFLSQKLAQGNFVTLFLGSLQLDTGALHYINAGHNPPYVFRNGGGVDALLPGGPIVGILDDVTYKSAYTELERGDLLAVFTDGIVEAWNEKEEEYSEERFQQLVKDNFNRPLQGIILKLVNDLRRHCNGMPYIDDLTLLLLKRNSE